jgi:ferric-dicitrate binding protein FerR (iron transport regulator)
VQEFTMPEGFEWSGLLIFRSTPMQTVVERLSDAFDLSISVSDDLKETPLTGTFESERGSTTILSIIASALGATVTERANGSLHVHR